MCNECITLVIPTMNSTTLRQFPEKVGQKSVFTVFAMLTIRLSSLISKGYVDEQHTSSVTALKCTNLRMLYLCFALSGSVQLALLRRKRSAAVGIKQSCVLVRRMFNQEL